MLETALAFGADAVDAGQPRYSLRVRNHSFHDKTALGVSASNTRTAGTGCSVPSASSPTTSGLAGINMKNGFSVGDRIEFIHPGATWN